MNIEHDLHRSCRAEVVLRCDLDRVQDGEISSRQALGQNEQREHLAGPCGCWFGVGEGHEKGRPGKPAAG